MYSSSAHCYYICFSRILSTNFWKKNISDDIFGKIDKKALYKFGPFNYFKRTN